MTFSIELSERGESGTGAAISVRGIDPRKMYSRARDVGRGELEISEIVVHAGRPASHIAVAKIPGDAGDAEQLHVPGSKRVEIGLKPHQVHDSIRRNVLGSTGRKDGISRDVICGRQVQRDKSILKWDRLARLRINNRRKNVGNGRSQEIVLP